MNAFGDFRHSPRKATMSLLLAVWSVEYISACRARKTSATINTQAKMVGTARISCNSVSKMTVNYTIEKISNKVTICLCILN